MYLDLCQENLRHSIPHPTKPDELLFLLFDTTHNFKNIFNKFLNKQKFNIPTNGHENLIGSSCFPSFSHLRHALEESKVLKIAHVLKKSFFNPSSIARTSPHHALGEYNILCCHNY